MITVVWTEPAATDCFCTSIYYTVSQKRPAFDLL